jgi:hypothetical protein
MDNVTVKLTIKTSGFTAPKLRAVLMKMQLDKDGIHAQQIEDRIIRKEGSVTFDLDTCLDENEKLKDI